MKIVFRQESFLWVVESLLTVPICQVSPSEGVLGLARAESTSCRWSNPLCQSYHSPCYQRVYCLTWWACWTDLCCWVGGLGLQGLACLLCGVRGHMRHTAAVSFLLSWGPNPACLPLPAFQSAPWVASEALSRGDSCTSQEGEGKMGLNHLVWTKTSLKWFILDFKTK